MQQGTELRTPGAGLMVRRFGRTRNRVSRATLMLLCYRSYYYTACIHIFSIVSRPRNSTATLLAPQ